MLYQATDAIGVASGRNTFIKDRVLRPVRDSISKFPTGIRALKHYYPLSQEQIQAEIDDPAWKRMYRGMQKKDQEDHAIRNLQQRGVTRFDDPVDGQEIIDHILQAERAQKFLLEGGFVYFDESMEHIVHASVPVQRPTSEEEGVDAEPWYMADYRKKQSATDRGD